MESDLFPYERIAIYSQDGFGLGHMRRTSSIAWQICQDHPNTSILTLSDSQLGQFFPTSHNHDYVKLPSIVKASPGNWKAARLGMPFEKILEMRKRLILSALTSFAPQVLLVDHMPHGAMGELIPALDALKASGIPTQVVLGLRDILDEPEVIIQRWNVEGAFEAIESYYSRVLVYGMQNLYDVVKQYRFPDSVASMVRYCGYVCTPASPSNVPKIRARFLAGTPTGTRFIVGMAGGGADAYPLMSALLDAVITIQADQPTVLAMITGPFMPADQISNLNQRAKHAPVRIMESVDDTLSYIAAADLVIAMAGYNTATEILRMKKKAILVPRSGPSTEQRQRARLFASRHWVDTVAPEDLSADTLNQKILIKMRKTFDIQPYTRPDLYGISVAAQQILALLFSTQEQAEVGVST